jgi:hypothetical protein
VKIRALQYCLWHDLRPLAFFLAFEYFLNCLKNQSVGSFYCLVRLRVIHICEGDLRPDLMTEILEHGTIKILGIANSYLLRNSVTTDDVLPEKLLNSGGGYVGYRLRFNPFGKVLDHDNGECVISLGWCEFPPDVDAPLLQRP